MKIRALRVAECGRFEAPTALEGLSGGLDVLAGPNELGKSTLLRALRAALQERHTTRKSDIEALRPYRGGAPLVEVDFEVGGETWRLRKRFLAERMAELRSLTSGRVARGADAETVLEQLIGASEGLGRIALLWLDQGDALLPQETGQAGQEALRSAIAREVASVAGGDRARRVRLRVKEALAELVTAGRGQKRGRYLAAQRELDEREAGLAKARQARSAVEDLLARLGRLEEQSQLLDADGARAARERRLAEAEAGLVEARDNIAGRDRARLAVADARAANLAAEAAARQLRDGLAEIERLDLEAAADEARAQLLRGSVAAADADLERVSVEVEHARRAQAAAEEELAIARGAQRRLDLSERHQRAVSAHARASELKQSLTGALQFEAGLREARRLAASIGGMSVRLEAQSAALTVAYDADAAGRVRIAGRPLAEGERVVADGPLVLEVEGVGRITVIPGAADDVTKLRHDLDLARQKLAVLLAEGQAADLADLEARYEADRKIAAELAEAQAHLAALAPQGLAALSEELAAVERGSTAYGTGLAARDIGVIEGEIARWRADLMAAEQRFAQLRDVRSQLGRDEAARDARAEERVRRRREIEVVLPPPEDRGQRRSALESVAAAASVAYDEALRTFSAWDARAPDGPGLIRLEAEAGAARDAVLRAERETAALAAERARVEGALEAVQGEDVEGAVAAREAETERAREQLGDLAETAAALQLLDAELAAEEARLRSLYVAPVTSRLGPYLAEVFADASIELGAGYKIESIARGGQIEELGKLSDGTREQIAVIVRLGFARLLADQGMAVPLVLDDALVYSDDERIKAMHRALERAAAVHQVIVLTCREQGFAGLRGHRVTLEPWQVTGTR